MNIKGLDHIPKPLEGIASRTAPRSRAQVLSELSSLQRQQERLEKKLKVWINNQKQTECDLRRVQQRRAFLEGLLDRAPADKTSEDGGGRKAATRREIPLPSPQPQPEPEPEPWERRAPIALERQRLGHRAARR